MYVNKEAACRNTRHFSQTLLDFTWQYTLVMLPSSHTHKLKYDINCLHMLT